MRLNIFYALLLSILLVVSSHAQTDDKPDFSGNWKLNKSRSSEQKDLNDLIDVRLNISATEQKVEVVRTLQFQNKTKTSKLTYYTDNRGEKNPKFRGSGKLKTQTYWSNIIVIPIFPIYQLVSDYTIIKDAKTVHMFLSDEDKPSRVYTQKATDSWDLSADGKTLTITTEIRGAEIERSPLETEIGKTPKSDLYKKVFDKIN